jgi:radical SAM superfamily enzyme YgiQ (UPF0313 family)
MSTLLIFPALQGVSASPMNSKASHPPLSLCCLLSYLKEKKTKAYGVDLNVDTTNTVYTMISRHNIQIIAFSVTTFTFDIAYQLAQEIKKKHPYIRCVFGGVIISLYEEVLSQKIIDALVVGEGEIPLYQLVSHYLWDSIPLKNIPNIIYYRNNRIIKTEKKLPSYHLDDLPLPDRTWIDHRKYESEFVSQCYISTSRFCPHGCNFCLSGTIGNTYRKRSIKSIIKEIRYIKKYYTTYKRFHFVDETLNISKERMIEFCKEIKEEAIQWSCNLKPDLTVTEELLVKMKESGLVIFEIGLESGNQYILDSMKKRTQLNHIELVLNTATRLGIPVLGSILIPYYCDTPKTLEDTISFVERLTNTTTLLPITVQTNIHPKSPNINELVELNIQTDQNHVIQSTKYLSNAQIQDACKKLQELFSVSLLRNGPLLSTLLDKSFLNNKDILSTFEKIDPSTISRYLNNQSIT